MKITIEFSAQLKRAAGCREISVEIPEGGSATDAACRAVDAIESDVSHLLFNESGAIQPSLLVFVNDMQADSDHVLNDGDRISFLSPISGG